MAIAASGAVSFSDLRTEYVGGSSAISYSDLYRGGSNIKSKEGDNPSTNLAASVPTSGTIDMGDFHGTAKGFKATISSSTTNVDVNTLFGGDYDTNYPKVVDINAGVTIGGSGDEAIDIPSGLAGSLTINNAGTVIGYGGASAGAAGGHAIACDASGVIINNSGQISGGGGAGANGSAGGNGSTSSTSTVTANVSFGFGYNSIEYNSEGGDYYWKYLGTTVYAPTCSPCYEAGSTFAFGGNYSWYTSRWKYIQRTGPVTTTTSTTGGAGGSFGVGAGYNQSATNGTSGASGGTNAGSGSSGTNGGALGTAASNSSAGGNGNVSNGAAGQSGGAAGAAVSGTSVTMNNSGTVHGAVA